MRLYQATLLDVSDGLEEAVQLPSSDIVPCTSALEFEFIEPGHRYIAEIHGFDRADIETAAPGSPLVLAQDGGRVLPRWSTTCWGQDGVTPGDLGLGGAGGDTGAGGASAEMGVESFSKTVVTVRGCVALTDQGAQDSTSVSFSIEGALVNLTCGEDEGQIAYFALAPSNDDEAAVGGAGGASEAAGLASEQAKCGEALLLEGEASGSEATYVVHGFEKGTDAQVWETTCHAVPRTGSSVAANCDPATSL
jgi:hypothetical protein